MIRRLLPQFLHQLWHVRNDMAQPSSRWPLEQMRKGDGVGQVAGRMSMTTTGALNAGGGVLGGPLPAEKINSLPVFQHRRSTAASVNPFIGFVTEFAKDRPTVHVVVQNANDRFVDDAAPVQPLKIEGDARVSDTDPTPCRVDCVALTVSHPCVVGNVVRIFIQRKPLAVDQ